MLLPGGARRGAVSCSGPLLLCGVFLPYKIHSGSNTSCSNYLLQSRRQHRSHRGCIFAHALLRQSWASLLQCRSSRANSSLTRAKAALRKGATPQKSGSGGRPEAVKTPLSDSAKSIPAALTPNISELKNEHARHEKLKADYYKAVSEDSNKLWLTFQERREVRDYRWITRPGGSRNPQRYGISRQNLYFRYVTGAISDPNVRERIVSWEQDTCKDLAPRFREMMLSRARVAHLQGFKSFFEYRSQFKMMNSTSVDLFLKDLKSKIDPYANAFMESAIEQKMNALGYDFTIKKLRERLHGGMTIRDYQAYHPEAQINWGDYSYYTTLKSKFISKSKESEDRDLKFDEYFPVDHSMRGVLSIFGNLLGLKFQEMPQGHQSRQAPIATYLKFQNLTEHNTALDVFWVFDITGNTPKRLGSLLLDVGEREGKPHQVYCTTFGSFSFENERSMHLPGVAIVAQFIKPTSRYPSIFNHEGLSTFAHELAHAIHKLLQGVNKPFIPGPRDFVEIPSITAEKWMSNPEVLQQISCHYTYLKPEYLTAWKDIFSPKIPPPQPPRQAPLEMFNEIHYEMHPRNDLYNTMQLLWKAKFDFIIHSSSEKDLRTMDFGVVCKQILDEQTGIFTPSDGKGEIRNNSYLYWGLLNNYDTSIYCYLLAKVYSYNIWSKQFASNPFNKSAARRYRKIVLEHHDTPVYQNPLRNLGTFLISKLFNRPRTHMEALTRFMGRKPDSRAFIKALKAPASRNQTLWRRLGIRLGIKDGF